MLLLTQKKDSEAIQCYDVASQIEQLFIVSMIQKIHVLESLGKHSEADQSNKILSAKLHSQIGHIVLNETGNIFADSGKFEQAIAYYNEAIKVAPKFVLSYHNKGLALCALGKYEDGIKEYDKALSINSKFWECLNNKGIALASMGQTQKAIDYYLQAIQIQPKLAILQNNLGNAYLALGKKAESIKCYDEALKIDPGFKDAYMNKLTVLLSLEKESKLIESKSKVSTPLSVDSGLSDTASEASLPDYIPFQINQFSSNFASMTSISTNHSNSPKELLSLAVQKIKTDSNEAVNISKDLLGLLKDGQNWPDEVIGAVAQSLCEIATIVPHQMKTIIDLVVERMQSDEELTHDFMSQILCSMVHIPGSML